MSSKVKLLYITVRADHGGGPKHLDLLLNNLSERFEVYIACPTDAPYYDLWAGNEKVSGLHTIPHRKFSVKSLLSLKRYIKIQGIRLVHSHGKGAGVYARALKLLMPGLKVVHTFHGVHIQEYNPLQKSAYLLFEKAAGKLTDKFINVSNGEKNICLTSGFSTAQRTSIIYNGIASPVVKNGKTRNSSEVFTVACISRFDYSKNMQLAYTIAKAFAAASDIRFIWIGDGPDKAALEEQASTEQTNNIIFTGFKDNPSDYLQQSDIYLSTSRWEGLPIALVEAAAMGLPIVASDVTGNDEVVMQGENGFLYPLNDYEKAVQYITLLHSDMDLYNRCAERSREVYNKYFRVEDMVRKTECVYLEP
ncbi:glycosyltransferase [Pontibacter russatus]|uniref:glycosyltransferase n=1 Tax=Pontibacter russatus TaxID=2694929 RepID=UPI00137B0D98|nr:glycosyltransferase [Pontibacter russatus]